MIVINADHGAGDDLLLREHPSVSGKRDQKSKKSKQQQVAKKRPQNKVERPLYQTLGEELLSTVTPTPFTKSSPLLHVLEIASPSSSSSYLSQHLSSSTLGAKNSFFNFYSRLPQSQSSMTVDATRQSEDSTFSGPTKDLPEEHPTVRKHKSHGTTYKLDDFEDMLQTESLILRYGRVAHMGVRDPSYSFWTNPTRTAAVHFKILNKVAVIGGDPLCHPDRLALSMHEFEEYCKQLGLKIAMIGASNDMAGVAKPRGWATMHFGNETVLNPQTNEVLLGKSGKRIVAQCKQLLDASRGGISVHAYSPGHGRDESIESQLRDIYDDWRNARNATRTSQAFITVFNLFAMNNLMTFLYTRDRAGRINGFAALRKLGANNGYHIDPFIQTSDAPRGVSDLLIYSSLAFLHAAGISYLSLGFEPLAAVNQISGLPSSLHSATRKLYKHVFGKIPVGGKEAFHARWKPDTSQESPLHLIFVKRIPSPRFMIAMTHYANISLRSIIKQDLQELRRRRSKKNVAAADLENTSSNSDDSGHDSTASKGKAVRHVAGA